jgi:hypothetical protein
MQTIRLRIADLFEFEGNPPPSQTPDLIAITPFVLKQFGFLPQKWVSVSPFPFCFRVVRVFRGPFKLHAYG